MNFGPCLADMQIELRKFVDERNAAIQALMEQVDVEIQKVHDAGLMVEKKFPVGVNEPMKNFWIKASAKIESV